MSRPLHRVIVIAALAACTAFVLAGISLASSTVNLKSNPTKLRFSTSTLRATHGKVTVRMTNMSKLKHGIAVEGHGVDKDGKIVAKGRVSTVTVSLKKGRYEFYCPVKGHKAAGMKGTLIVS